MKINLVTKQQEALRITWRDWEVWMLIAMLSVVALAVLFIVLICRGH